MQSSKEGRSTPVAEPGASHHISDAGAVRPIDLPAEHIKWAYAIARAIHRKIPGSFDLEDLQQIAVFKAWQKYQTWEPAKNDKFQGYAYMAVAGQVKMSVRRQNWFEHSDLVGETHFENGLDSLMRSPDDPETQVQLAELATKVEALPERERLVIQQYFSDGVETDMLRNAIARLREIYQQPLRGLTIQFGLFDEYA